ncbi:MAG: Sua5 family C-terminal domain-containing protein [Gemmatimonadota bacterium]
MKRFALGAAIGRPTAANNARATGCAGIRIATLARPAAITWSEAGRTAAVNLHVHLHLDASPLAYAAELYAALHAVDDAGCGTVLVEEVPMDPAWDGIRDRLARAAHP